ncbi:exodeoxyribonuclease VII large subunit [Paenibacillus sp. IB182496]|uniref:Exodeoxyribonuclease 7 large subunit n=1 Tax=Paenibacillus sabuli TaxID=2772509 RepID=A0A927BXL7_9BACL|nr:exodeoxyribonuclease VII large subunit [Paenibacillus sabuli]MBD2847299.1 exodeoxyribonuclease VII large subunit [Paenibacillus sabuli]
MAEQPRIYTIKEVNRYIRMKLDSDALLSGLWLRGEISNFTHHSSGHMYFTLKDKDSRLKCIMFASHNSRLPFRPNNGTKVVASGNISVYERDGAYQFYITAMQPDGLGSLHLAYEQLKKKLDTEGLFAPERKRPVPAFPRGIAVVTSPTGAAVRDILTTLKRRFPSVPVLLVPVSVQGAQAAPSIVRAFELVRDAAEIDVLIIGRGGGSLEELWAFNEEAVARAIVASPVPVISAVGHETDYTIADFVADLRAATPTAAAELAVPHQAELRQQLTRHKQRMTQALQSQLRRGQERLARMQRATVLTQPHRALLEPVQRLDRATARMTAVLERRAGRGRERLLRAQSKLAAVHPGARLEQRAQAVAAVRRSLRVAMLGRLRDHRAAWSSAVRGLDALSPLKVMGRGYSLVYDEHGKRIIRSIKDVQPGDQLKVKITDGELDCQVWSMKGEHANDEQDG